MSEETPQTSPGSRERGRRRHSRKLSRASRVREALRGGADRLLGVDLAWSALLVVVVLGLFASQRCGSVYRPLALNQIADEDIRADRDLDAVNWPLTEQRRAQARAAVPDVYVHDLQRHLRLTEELRRVFEEARGLLEDSGSDAQAAARLRSRLGGRVADPALMTLIRERFSPELESHAVTALGNVMSRPVIGNRALLERKSSILVVHLPGELEQEVSDFSTILDLATAHGTLEGEVSSIARLRPATARAVTELASIFLDTNLTLDAQRTATRRDAAAAAVLPVLEKIPRGERLVRQGQRIDAATLARVDAARQAVPGTRGVANFLGLATIVLMSAFFLYRYALYHQRHYRGLENLHALLIVVLLLTLLAAQALRWLAREVVDGLPFPFDQVEVYTYFVPIGAGPILIALLANGRIAMVYSAFTSLLLGGLVGWDFFVAAWALLVQWGAVYAISAYRERAALLRAGLVVGGVAATVALALEVVQGTLEPMSRSLFAAGLAFLGGALWVGLLGSYALPLFEGLFHVLTDIRLLELSNVNNPLLSQLAVKAPGTYNHSVVVATLAEEAAKGIGANSLLCRVAAFYHDIGKIVKPEYFVENMRGTNPHDRLSPSMSALIIAAHVKEGVKLAREAGLPQRIVDIIPQHHGTRLMSYFYNRAKENTDPSMGPIKEEDFRYPGPKPQTKEAAIFMLADGVEAASRTVEDPTPNRLREMIRKITNTIVLDRQLDECDLTFADLTGIREAFLRTLVSFHHQRVDYPGFDFKRRRAAAGKAARPREADGAADEQPRTREPAHGGP